MLSCVALLFVFLALKGTCIDISTSGVFEYQSLTQYGYVYEPQSNCRAQFTFQVRACAEVHIALFQFEEDLASAIEMYIGGYANTRWRISNNTRPEFFSEHYVNGSLDCDTYSSFWIAWINWDIVAGIGNVSHDVMLSFTDQTATQVRLIGISTKHYVIGDWKIPDQKPSLFCFQQTQMKLSSGLWNTNMTVNIKWSVTAKNLGQCAVTCTRSSSCVSFVYNHVTSKCQGHGEKFNTMAEGQGHIQSGSHYYIKP